jgi:hypothetical protein
MAQIDPVAEAIAEAGHVENETRYRLQLARDMYQLGLARGRAEHVAEADAAMAAHLSGPLDPEMVDTINRNAAAEHIRIEEARWGPGGRTSWLIPRAALEPARWSPAAPGREPTGTGWPAHEHEAEAG